MWIMGILISVVTETIPIFAGLIVKALLMKKEGGNMLHAANLAMKIAIMLAEIRKGEVHDLSQAHQSKVELEGRMIQLLDLSEAEIEVIELTKVKAARIDAHRAKITKLNGRNMLVNILDVSESVIDELDLTDSNINVLDACRAEIKTLNLSGAHILNMDLSESTIHNLVGRNSARVYMEIRWQSKISRETKDKPTDET
ncbi:MAG: hypothetical protein RUDDFDWM_002083 [Candidatus Fervidibacterota bacterium]